MGMTCQGAAGEGMVEAVGMPVECVRLTSRLLVDYQLSKQPLREGHLHHSGEEHQREDESETQSLEVPTAGLKHVINNSLLLHTKTSRLTAVGEELQLQDIQKTKTGPSQMQVLPSLACYMSTLLMQNQRPSDVCAE